MHYRDDDPSGTAPKTTLYETEPGMSVENAKAVSTRLILVVSPACCAWQELAQFRNAVILESMLSDFSCGFRCFGPVFGLFLMFNMFFFLEMHGTIVKRVVNGKYYLTTD